MKIKNVRLGHACNSSSSHSIILMSGATDNTHGEAEFGWDLFTASGRDSKTNYLAKIVEANLIGQVGQDNARLISKALFGETPDGYVDHQSVFAIPSEIDSREKHLNWEFIEDLKGYLMRDDVVIIGGNDNGDEGHPLAGAPVPSWYEKIEGDGYDYDFRCRKDGDWWTIFNRTTGARISISFLDNPSELNPKTPFLLDVKVSDYCPFGCTFCYQSSTEKGKHSRLTPYAFVEDKVFEIAIGGGEPTLWPGLWDFVAELNECGINANMTTRNIKWFKSADIDAWMAQFSAVAVSADDPKTVKEVMALVEKKPWRRKIVFQVIDGLVSEENAQEIIDLVSGKHELCVLGYKSVGFGSQVDTPYPRGILLEKAWPRLNWKYCYENDVYQISLRIDTAMAQRYEEELKDHGVNGILYTKTEGDWSAYFDAVESIFAPSSWCSEEERFSVDTRRPRWLSSAFGRLKNKK